MDRQNRFFLGEIPGLDGENADTATPRDRIDRALRDRIFAEEDGIFRRDADIPARPNAVQTAAGETPVTRRHLLRQIQNYSIAMAQATMHLDMHPGDPSFLRHYNRYRALLTDAVRAYESRYGKLTASPFPPS